MNQETQIIAINDSGDLVYTQWDQLTAISKQIMNAGITKIGNPVQINLIILKGKKLGIDMFEALENISVINNKTCINGALASALVLRSGLLVDKSHVYEGEGDARKCTVTVQRKGMSKVSWSFSIKEAKHAGLYPGKAGSGWFNYSDTMLYWRALGFSYRREFPDVMQGMYLTEEIVDEAREINITPQAEMPAPMGQADPSTKEPPTVPKRVVPFVPDPTDPKAHEHPIISEPSMVNPPASTELDQLRELAARDNVTEELLIEVVNGLRLFPRGAEQKLENLPLVKVSTLLKNWPVVMRNVDRIKAEQEKELKGEGQG